MSRVKTENTHHSYYRAAERCGLSKKRAREMMKAASRYGTAPLNLPEGPIQDYLLGKQLHNPHKRIKLYKNYVFVFCSTSTKCITVYKLPEELLGESEKKDEFTIY